MKSDYLDRLFSLYIRARSGWRCELCGKEYITGAQELHCSHFQGRGKEATRFDPDNAMAACGVAIFGEFKSCHEQLEHDKERHYQVFSNRLGKERCDELILRANTGKPKDRTEVSTFLRSELEKMQTMAAF